MTDPPPPGNPARGGVRGFNAEFLSAHRSERIFAWHLERLGITRVLDIGANSGQFAAKLRQFGYSGLVYSVEPQASAHRQLVENTRRDLRWIALARQGAGASPAMLELNIAANGWSSSLREVHENHIHAEPATRTVAQERVFINRTSELLRPEVLATIEALKIDVQGYEDQVLAGYAPWLERVRLLQLELSLVECYRGGPDLFTLDELLVGRHGFSRVSLEPAYYDDRSGTVQQYDGIYHRPASQRAVTAPPEGVRVGAVVTSIGGPLARARPDGTDCGPEWLELCAASWRAVCSRVLSVAECSAPAGLEWVSTAARPSIAELVSAAPLDQERCLLLTNADIALTQDLLKLLPALDPLVMYYGHRVDVEAGPSNPRELVARGVYGWGFDYFLLPQPLADALKTEPLLPAEFRIGEPWWDYALPVAALALGFPVKRLATPAALALHYVHPARYRRELWLANGERFVEFARQLLARGTSSATGLLTDIVSQPGEGEARLQSVAQLICQTLP
jgi:FkbM family methyltransferase